MISYTHIRIYDYIYTYIMYLCDFTLKKHLTKRMHPPPHILKHGMLAVENIGKLNFLFNEIFASKVLLNFMQSDN